VLGDGGGQAGIPAAREQAMRSFEDLLGAEWRKDLGGLG
jgi:hypothetical protein